MNSFQKTPRNPKQQTIKDTNSDFIVFSANFSNAFDKRPQLEQNRKPFNLVTEGIIE